MSRCTLLLAALLVIGAASLVAARPLSQPAGDVDGLRLAQQNAVWYSVCKGTAAAPTVPPTSSPLQPPVIDPATEAIGLTIVAGQSQSCVAWGFYSDTIDTVGWSYLSIETNQVESDYLQSRAAGMLEGYLTQARIAQYIPTLLPGFMPNGLTPALSSFLNETLNFNSLMIKQVAAVDPYWAHIGCLYMQVSGLFEGYTLANTNPADAHSWFDLLSLQLDVDFGDIETAIGLFSPLATDAEKQHAQEKMDKRLHPKNVDMAPQPTHCSALVKLLPNNTDLIMGHDTWSGFNTMLRIFKLHTMPLSISKVLTVHQSSYPGFLFSSDDWYQLQGPNNVLLTVTETTNDIYAPALYAAIEPGTVQIWARTMVANRLAEDGQSWAEIFSRYNSGTCDNQWIIVNHALFTPGAAKLTPGLLTISEQTPGLFVTRDMTDALQLNGYWSSFNIPALTWDVSGYSNCQGGDYVCSYYQNFRYLLFQQQEPNVVDLETMQKTLMYNEWQTNPLQHNRSSYAIASRYDLLPGTDAQAYGGIDAKITTDSWMKQGALRVSTVCGPTKETQPAFCWQSAAQQPPGQPKCFNFPWIQYYINSDAAEAAIVALE